MKYTLILGSMLAITACKVAPTPCYSIDKGKTAKLNEEVQFNASCTLDANYYEWNFGDGSAIAGGITQKHKYTTEGTYAVKLTVKNGKVVAEKTDSLKIEK
ncbi:MAG: PKD domain-containing protein [Flavobacteriaceae bacterium]|nr:PKD domain-containing protein [Flavobacteriaceae bacterium]